MEMPGEWRSDDRGDAGGWTAVAKGAVAGALGGLVGSWVMNYTHGVSSAVSRFVPEIEQAPAGEPATKSEPATATTASTISETVFGKELSEEEKKSTGSAVHYGYGTMMGAVYGAACEVYPRFSSGAGIPYAIALWLGGDEVAVPMLGLGSSPKRTPVSTQVDALAAHAAYGLTTDAVRRLVRAVL